jgi:cyclophilin family peptidyl-prolyl cis-trans isomerase
MITKRAAEFLTPAHSFQTRLAAAHFFSRSQKVSGNGFQQNLIRAALDDRSSEVRMAAVNGFRHLDMAEALPSLERIYSTDRDYRVRISAVRAGQGFSDDKDRKIIFYALRDSVEVVQVAAAEALRNIAHKDLASRISTAIAEVMSPRATANLYAALLKLGQPGALDELMTRYPSAPPYFKSALLSALSESQPPWDQEASEFLAGEMTNQSNEKVVLTSAAAALVTLDGKAGELKRKDFLKAYQEAIAQGDAAVIGIICSALVNESLHYREEIKDLGFLYDAKLKLRLPRDIESLQPLEEAIAFLEGKEKPKAPKNEFNHPIDWKLVQTILSDQKVEIETTKGTIIIRLVVEESPGSVSNFVDLVNKKYFDGKFFHRVVPNFVIQTGCNRGDGYGSEDYSIRSEFGRRRYAAGSVGMASAGKDTEGTQWFITHSPTPHLDGKYTIFAEVVSGMEVVHHMEVGDRMLVVRLE